MDEPSTGRPAHDQTGQLHGAVLQWHRRLTASLDETRARLSHSGNKGDANESAFRTFLRSHLSPKYQIGQGEVIDSRGERSRQVDVAIADDEQPLPVTDSPELLIVEGITAAGEVKTRLTTKELSNCVEGGRAFKTLEPVLGKYEALAGATLRSGEPNSDLVRFYHRRPFFVFAYETAVSLDRLVDTLRSSESPHEVPPIDAVFLLDKGFALNLWDGKGQLAFLDPATGTRMEGWVVFKEPKYSLTFLLFWLHFAMPRFGMRSSAILTYLLPGTTFIPDIPIDKRRQ